VRESPLPAFVAPSCHLQGWPPIDAFRV
jgi:hypothetical protein